MKKTQYLLHANITSFTVYLSMGNVDKLSSFTFNTICMKDNEKYLIGSIGYASRKFPMINSA